MSNAVYQSGAKINQHIIVRLSDLSKELFADPKYAPNRLLNILVERYDLKNDMALSRALHLPIATISKIRNRKLLLSGAILLRIHEVYGIPVAELRTLAGVPSHLDWAAEMATAKR